MKLLLTILFFFGLIATVTDIKAQTNTVSSTVSSNTIDKAPPSAISPSVVINNSNICKTAVASSVSTQILGFSSGVTIRDTNCELLLLSQNLARLGLKIGAVSILAQNDSRVFDSLWLAGTFPPIHGKIGLEAKELWLLPENRHLVPEGSKIFGDLPIKNQEEGVNNVVLYKTLFLISTGLLLF